MNKQLYFYGKDSIKAFIDYIGKRSLKVLIVSGNSCKNIPITKKIVSLLEEYVFFSDFSPNPTYESVKKGVELFLKEGCEAILAIGGGSTMDVAKCIKLFSTMRQEQLYLSQPFEENNIALYAIPTTAGTGSESTEFAVIYYLGEKQSIAHSSLIPTAVLFEASSLETISDYQRRATMLDALCHAIESFWSLKSTEESRNFSKEALQLIFNARQDYLENTSDGNVNMLRAANLAGKAINIAQTTAAHAMCYKVTSLYNIAHGHAAACILPELWKYMYNNIDKCRDCRGKEFVKGIFEQIAILVGCDSIMEAICLIQDLLFDLGLQIPKVNNEDIDVLVSSVNMTRLKNNPVELDENDIENIYRSVFIK